MNLNYCQIGGPLSAECLAQAAKVRAIRELLEQRYLLGKELWVYTDLDFCAKALLYWIHNWSRANWHTADGKEIAQKNDWQAIWKWIQNYPSSLHIRHVKGHQ